MGAIVSLLDVGVSAVSDREGRFVLQDTPSGAQVFGCFSGATNSGVQSPSKDTSRQVTLPV